MKQIINKLKQSLCLMLGICLLTSSVPVFAQEVPYTPDLIQSMFEETTVNFESLEQSLAELEKFVNNPQKYLDEIVKTEDKLQISNAITRLSSHFASENEKKAMKEVHPFSELNDSFTRALETYKNICQHYQCNVDLSNGINEKGVLKELARRYTDPKYLDPSEITLSKEEIETIENIFPKEMLQLKYFDLYIHSEFSTFEYLSEKKYNASKTSYISGRFYDGTIVWVEEKDFEQMKQGVKFLKAEVEKMKQNIALINRVKAELLRQKYTPAQVMEYAFKEGMLPKAKDSVKLIAQAMDPVIKVPELVNYMTEHLKAFEKGTFKDIKYYPVEGLMKELEGMSIAERAKYVEGLTDLEKGSQTFLKDMEKLDPYSRRYVAESIKQGFWPVAALAALITVYTIVSANADNHFNKATKSQRELAEIGKKIENGIADRAEKWIFFTNPISKQFVETDPVYTLHFVKLASDVYQAEELLKEMKAAETKQQKQDVENTFMDSYQKISDKLAKDPQLGTL